MSDLPTDLIEDLSTSDTLPPTPHEPDPEPSPRPVHEPDVPPPTEPTPELIAAIREYYARKREEYLERIAYIESFLGFSISEEDLGRRVARLEKFTGLR